MKNINYLKATKPKVHKRMKTIRIIGSDACHPTILRAIKQDHGIVISPYDSIGLNAR